MNYKDMKCVVIDKNNYYQQSYARYLLQSYPGMQVFPTDNVDDGLAMAQAKHADLIVADYFPNGGTAMTLLRRLGNPQDYGVVVITNPDNEQMAREVVEAGAAEALPRNAHLNELGQVVQRVLYRRPMQAAPKKPVYQSGKAHLRGIISGMEGNPTTQIRIGKWYALLIGVDTYQDPNFGNLKAPPKDVALLKKRLRERYEFDEMQCLTGEDATWNGIDTTVKKFQEVGVEADSLLIFFAGHGLVEDASGEGFWIPYDGVYEKPQTWYPSHRLCSLVSQIPMRHVLVMADCCFSGALIEQNQRDISKVLAVDANLRDYYSDESRWALTSARLKAVEDQGFGENSPFIETLSRLLDGKKVLIPEVLCAQLREDEQLKSLEQLPICSRIRHNRENLGHFLFIPKTLTSS